MALALDPLPEPAADIVCLKGAHLPKSEAEFHTMMPAFQVPLRQPGPEEVFYQYFEHYVYHPYRPSPAGVLAESLSAPFVQITNGSVIGVAGIHLGFFQDNSLESMKAQFILELINWRHRWAHGEADKIWTFGGGGAPFGL